MSFFRRSREVEPLGQRVQTLIEGIRQELAVNTAWRDNARVVRAVEQLVELGPASTPLLLSEFDAARRQAGQAAAVLANLLMEALKLIADEGAVQPLLSRLSEPGLDYSHATSIVQALSKTSAGVRALAATVSSSAPAELRALALSGMSYATTEFQTLTNTVEVALGDSDASVRAQAVVVISVRDMMYRMRRSTTPPPVSTVIMERLRDIATGNSDDDLARENASKSLRSLGGS